MSTPDPVAAAGAAAPGVRATSPGSADAPGRGSLSERVAGALLAHPDVVRLSGGTFGSIATYLPGRRLVGVALGDGEEPARISVVLRLGARVRPTAEALRALVAAETGARRVDVVVTDVVDPADPTDPAAAAP
ncbi:hypothetical protein [Actinomycetospora termitidis]|uniref:Asp23/Gls24 family envelope stress response protein n=1 Tax=Actinomycetospora termitidis TaxID=3053470 RepID=A0ABT7MB17_9PSEU|nr:hypothetical protein [Actinomycetospora sp. Odt1-22]MDL5156613.1 hypothetical protein [Actinomycetospora sp. Odt1-22]